ncbi:MAG TPA: CBS domain-containing protein [Anaerolineae bacterium]
MKSLTVRDWMTPNPITVTPSTTVPEANTLMKQGRIRRLPVVENGKLVGIVTLGDIREASPSDATSLSIYELNYLVAQLTVEKIMTKDPVTIDPNASIKKAAKLLLEHKIGSLPVMDGGMLVGIITESDIFRVLVRETNE